jgi:hypothetical protein
MLDTKIKGAAPIVPPEEEGEGVYTQAQLNRITGGAYLARQQRLMQKNKPNDQNYQTGSSRGFRESR